MYKKFISFFITIFFSLTIGKVSYSSYKEKEQEKEQEFDNSKIRSSLVSNRVYGELRQIDSSDHPFFKTVLSLECDFGEISGHGTAFLIDEHFALTAAHVVLNRNKGLAKKVTCHFASNPTDTFCATSFAYPRNYQEIYFKIASKEEVSASQFSCLEGESEQKILHELEKEKISHDYALIYFKKGLFKNSLKALFSEDLTRVIYAGYPSDRAEQNRHITYSVLNEGQTSIIKVEDGIVVFKSQVLSGMSGGPVSLNLDRLDRPIAVISATRDRTFSRYSVACLLTSDKLANIDKWKKILAADQYKKFDSASTAIEAGVFCKIDTIVMGINVSTLGSLYNKFIGN